MAVLIFAVPILADVVVTILQGLVKALDGFTGRGWRMTVWCREEGSLPNLVATIKPRDCMVPTNGVEVADIAAAELPVSRKQKNRERKRKRERERDRERKRERER